MGLWRIFTLVYLTTILVDAKVYKRRDITTNVCDPVYNNTNEVHCSCENDIRDSSRIKSADCYLSVEAVTSDDPIWEAFKYTKNIHKLVLTSAKGIVFNYIPTNAIKNIENLKRLDVKYNNIRSVEPFAFANHSSVEEITLRDNQIVVLRVNAFAHHADLTTINLDKNNIVEINRDVFIDLPSLDKLYLTANNITTIHDRAFIHLMNLKELEISTNNLFSLNSETFSGLKKLQRLDLSSNSLEVIGDNTFLPLSDLISLDLSSNKIQMLDNRAFHGLSKLEFLSLSHNNLSNIDNLKVFDGLKALISLSLKSNQLKELKVEVMAPIVKNFKNEPSYLDVEDNYFPCDCRLEWLVSLMNKIANKRLKLALENFKCIPSTELRDLWNKTEDSVKSTQQVDDENTADNDYEYYDDTQLDGKLFYIDVRDLLNCTPPNENKSTTAKTVEETITKAVHRAEVTTPKALPDTIKQIQTSTQNNKEKAVVTEKRDPYTTTRLATVSASPLDKKGYEDMASDEAVPDKIKAHRSIQDVKETPKFNVNYGYRTLGCVPMILSIILCLTLL